MRSWQTKHRLAEGWPLVWPWPVVGLAMGGPWPSQAWPFAWPCLAFGLSLSWPGSGSNQFLFKPVLVHTGSNSNQFGSRGSGSFEGPELQGREDPRARIQFKINTKGGGEFWGPGSDQFRSKPLQVQTGFDSHRFRFRPVRPVRFAAILLKVTRITYI